MNTLGLYYSTRGGATVLFNNWPTASDGGTAGVTQMIYYDNDSDTCTRPWAAQTATQTWSGTYQEHRYSVNSTRCTTLDGSGWVRHCQSCDTDSWTDTATLRWATNDGVWLRSASDLVWLDVPRPVSPGDRLRQIMDSRQAPLVIGSRKALAEADDVREQRARETLRRVIGDEKYRCFLRQGFISVRGRSGQAYQIFPGHGITQVYEGGKMVERLCVVLSGDFPPTDSMIMRYLMILNNERQFRSLANKHNVTPRPAEQQPLTQRSLVEIYRDLKAGKHVPAQPTPRPTQRVKVA